MSREIPPIPGSGDPGRLETVHWLNAGWGCRWCKVPLSFHEVGVRRFVIYCATCDLDPDLEVTP